MQHYEHKRKANDPKFHKALTFYYSYSAACTVVGNMAYKRFHKIYRPCQAV